MSEPFDALPDAAFVDLCYRTLLSRECDDEGRGHYVQALSAGLTRIGLVKELAGSTEHAALVSRRSASPFLLFAPPGHFYSPLPAPGDAGDYERLALRDGRSIPGIDVREAEQLELLRSLANHYYNLIFPRRPDGTARFHHENGAFGYFDAVVLGTMLRHFRPRRVLEIGSGFSSALMLDVNERFLGGGLEWRGVDPEPRTLRTLLRPGDLERVALLEMPVQDVPREEFDRLEAGDVLFVDSSDVVKFGSDVAHLVLRVLPELKAGVLVHFHDVFWPFEYPPEWLREGRAWNEAYVLRAFLSFNPAFRILLFNDFLFRYHREELARLMPLCLEQPEGSPFSNSGVGLWLRKDA